MWHSLASISVTPVAKFGIGQLIAFDFLAPCFGDQQADLLQYDGKIKFDFKQFGDDDQELQRQSPSVYCQKVCHKIGFYLQKIHAMDLVRMRVEF